MRTKNSIILSAALAAISLLACSCANFRKLGKDLKMLDDEYRISGIIHNADDYKSPVRAVVVEWDSTANKVFSGDRVELTAGGAFLFLVKSPLNQHVAAYADENRDGKYTKGEPMWIHRGSDGKPTPVAWSESKRFIRVNGSLSNSESPPAGLAEAIASALAGRRVEDVMSNHGVRFAIGEKASLDDPRFAATRGEDGLWTPASFAIQSGFGIYFVERFDPSKTPVLFVHGAAGSPQDWRLAMDKLDRNIYQPWFYVYPSGMSLSQAGSALNDGVKQLHDRATP